MRACVSSSCPPHPALRNPSRDPSRDPSKDARARRSHVERVAATLRSLAVEQQRDWHAGVEAAEDVLLRPAAGARLVVVEALLDDRPTAAAKCVADRELRVEARAAGAELVTAAGRRREAEHRL